MSAQDEPVATEPAAEPADGASPDAPQGSSEQDSDTLESQIGLGTEKEESPDETYDPSSPFAKAERHRRKKTYGHGFQFGARAGMVFPYKIRFAFDESSPCDPDGDGEAAKTCGFAPAPQLDLALSFAPLDAVEPFAWMRLGLGEEDETNTDSLFLLGAGARIYTMNESKFKLFFEAAGGFQFEGALDEDAAGNANFDTDIFAMLGFGPQYDFNRYIGVFGNIGSGVSFVRSIAMQLEARVGVQLRAP